MTRSIFSRESFIPVGATKVSDKASDAVVYIYSTKSGRLGAMMFAGKRAKPDQHFTYRTAEAREASVCRYLDGIRAATARKATAAAERREALAKSHGVEVGHIFAASWGYDQTNVDFYEVTAIIGRRMVEVRKIAAIGTDTGASTGTVVPNSGRYVGEPMRRMVDASRGIKIDTCRWASLWPGRPLYFSDYA